MDNTSNKKVAIVPGSFDPITLGHIDIVKRALLEYDTVVLAIMINPNKNYMFTMQQRERIANSAFSDEPRVKVISSSGMLWKLAKELGACAIVKGYRNEIDLKYEEEMAEFNLSHNPDAPTVLLKSDEKLELLSSTVVRQKIMDNEPLNGLLPPKAIDEINKIIVRHV